MTSVLCILILQKKFFIKAIMNTQERILGYDIARAFAIFGMMVVNYHLAMNANAGSAVLNQIALFFYGKASATFVMLAGIGLVLMSRKAKMNNQPEEMRKHKIVLLKRAAFLFVVGLINYYFWIGDILHFYAFYISIGAILLYSERKTFIKWLIIALAASWIMFIIFDFTKGWDFANYNITDKWTFSGLIRTIFFNGIHPVFPWIAYLLFGMFMANSQLHNRKIRNKFLIIALIVFVLTQIISQILLKNANTLFGTSFGTDELWALFGTDNIPPLPIAMLTGGSFAIIVICCSLYLNEFWKDNLLSKIFSRIGQMSLTIYLAHIILGFGFYLIFIRKIFTFDIPQLHKSLFLYKENVIYSFLMVFIFFTLSGFFAYFWKEKFKQGPLELLMRKFSGNVHAN